MLRMSSCSCGIAPMSCTCMRRWRTQRGGRGWRR
uniref:Uncharacterized protein n=1 Tax=Arundo donax TaxID=35708 RepID=A0A0A8ZMG4_ARUDO